MLFHLLKLPTCITDYRMLSESHQNHSQNSLTDVFTVRIFLIFFFSFIPLYIMKLFNPLDVPVWSKLETGRIPQPNEMFQIIENHMRLYTNPVQ